MTIAGRTLTLFAALFLILIGGVAHAHKPSDSYLKLDIEGATIAGQWDIALRDLDFAIGLDSNQDDAITWGEVMAKHEEIAAYALSRLKLGSAGGANARRSMGEQLIDNHSDGAYAVLRFTATCPSPPTILATDYRLFFDVDPQHRGLLSLSSGGGSRAGIFSVDQPVQQFTLGESSRVEQFVDYLKEGVLHIWAGFDHILFLLSLLLPAVLVRSTISGEAWAAGSRLQSGVLGRAEGRHRLHRGAFDHAVAGCARRGEPAVAAGRIGDRRVRGARCGQQHPPGRLAAAAGSSRSASG